MAEWAASPAAFYYQSHPIHYCLVDRSTARKLYSQKVRKKGRYDEMLVLNGCTKELHRQIATYPANQHNHVGKYTCEAIIGSSLQKCAGFSCNRYFSSGFSVYPMLYSSIHKPTMGCRDPLKYRCHGTISDFSGIITVEWNYIVDEVLLATTVALAYFSGIINHTSPYFLTKQEEVLTGSADENASKWLVNEDTEDCAINAWTKVQEKLSEALDDIVIGHQENGVLEDQQFKSRHVLSLQAIEKGPRLRLLLITLLYLQKEVDRVRISSQNLEQDEWTELSLSIFNTSISQIYEDWIKTEASLRESDFLKDDVILPESFQMGNFIAVGLKNSGKMVLHSDLLFFLCHGSPRSSSLSAGLVSKHAVDILEDMVISLADGIASLYLELISLDSSISGKIEFISLLHTSYMSTRALEKFRNEVSLNRWLYNNFCCVAAIYEDRFDVWTLNPIIIKQSREVKTGFSWWGKMQKKVQRKESRDIQLCQIALRAKRIKELRSLKGWRYFYSIFLEVSDIAGPLLREFFGKISSGLAFILKTLIGRSLGLIYRGIRQSVSWKS